MIFRNQLVKIKMNPYLFNMEGQILLGKAMDISYKMLMGEDIEFEPNDSNKIEDMIFIPDPEISELEMASNLLEYFESTEEYEKCTNIKNIIKLNKIINKCLK
jgi:hypothetical protein